MSYLLLFFFSCIGVSVTVSVWTMVAISLERYHAICNPLSSRIWQTKRHAYRAIAAVWILGFLLFIPTIIFTKLIPLNEDQTQHMCREVWPHVIFKKVILVSMGTICVKQKLYNYKSRNGRAELSSQDSLFKVRRKFTVFFMCMNFRIREA